jgi:hypothetical protein
MNNKQNILRQAGFGHEVNLVNSHICPMCSTAVAPTNMSNKDFEIELRWFSQVETADCDALPADVPQMIQNEKFATAKRLGFKDILSVKEFLISGLCQKCQDAFFD